MMSNIIALFALIVSIATLVIEGSYKKFLETEPDISVRVVESDSNKDIKILVANSGGLPAVITRVWLSQQEKAGEPYSNPIQLSLKGEDRLVEVNKVLVVNPKSEIPIPSLLESHELKKNKGNSISSAFEILITDYKCKLTLELSGIDNYKKSVEEEFDCSRTSIVRTPREN